MSAFQTQKCRLSPENVKNGNFHSDNLRWCLRFCVSSSQVMLMFMVHAKNWVKGLCFKSNNNLPLIIIVIILYKSYLKKIMVNMKINNWAHKKNKFIESCQYRTSCSNSWYWISQLFCGSFAQHWCVCRWLALYLLIYDNF